VRNKFFHGYSFVSLRLGGNYIRIPYWVFLGVLALALFPLAVIVYNHIGEDCFITFRYAEQWLRGRGLVFNPGERVEGYSNFLWLALMAAAKGLTGASMFDASRWLSVAAHAGMLLALGWAAVSDLRANPEANPNKNGTDGTNRTDGTEQKSPSHNPQPTTHNPQLATSPTAHCSLPTSSLTTHNSQLTTIPWHRLWLPLAIFLCPFLHYHADRGLETVFFAALLGVAMVCAAERRWLAGGLAMAAVALTRPEGVFHAIAFVPLVWWEFDTDEPHLLAAACAVPIRERLRRAALFLGLPILAWAAQTLIRHGYYGEWIPNSAIAKLGRGRAPSGWGEVLRWTIAMNGMPLLALAGFCAGWRLLPERRRLVLAAACAFIAAIAYQAGIGRVAATAFRYLIPAIAPVLVLTAMLVEALYREGGFGRWGRRAVVIILLVLAAFTPPRATSGGHDSDPIFAGNGDANRTRFHVRIMEFLCAPDWAERWLWFRHEPIMLNAEVGRWLRSEIAKHHPRALLAADQMGQLGYYASHDQSIIDLGGLMDREIARDGLRPESLVRRAPDFLILFCRLDNDRPLLPELQALVDSPVFREHYEPRWRLQARDTTIFWVQFIVWARRDALSASTPPMTPADVLLGPTTADIDRFWRVRENAIHASVPRAQVP